MRNLKSIAAAGGLALLLTLTFATSLLSQGTAQAQSLKGTIKDPSGAAMPAVDVSVLQAGKVVKATKSDSIGVFSFDLLPGQYQLAVIAPDFNTYTQAVRVIPNMPALAVTLDLKNVTSTVEVVGNSDKITVDAAQSLDAQILTADQIADLPEDESDLLAFLQALAGGEGNAQLIIDGFEGGRLPRRDQIAQIVIEPNSFNATGTGPRITVVTREPGPRGPWTGRVGFQYRDSALNARTPHSENKPNARRSVMSTNSSGPVIKGRLGMTINLSKQQYESSNNSIRAITLNGPINTSVFSPGTYNNIEITNNWFFSQTHTVTHSINYNSQKDLNQGPGGFTLEERASDSKNHTWNFQISDNKTISPKMTNTANFRFSRGGSLSIPRTNAIAINVLDAFYSGGAQNRSESRNSNFNINDTLRWTPNPKLNYQFYVNINHQARNNFSENNFLGTFTFASLDDYVAGRALTFTQSSGNPLAETKHTDANIAANVTYRISPTMSYSAGVQYFVQTHLKDYNNIAPTTQLQIQFKKRHTLMVGARLSYPNVGFPIFQYEQLIRGDGTTRQFNTVISNPTYPDPFAGGVTGTTTGVGSSLQLRAKDFVSPYTINTQVQLIENLPKNWRVVTTFAMNRGVHQLRNRNINAPYPGTFLDPTLTPDEIDLLRPFYPNVGRINQFESVGNSLQENLSFQVQVPSKKILKTQISGQIQPILTWQSDDSQWQNPYNMRADWARNDQRFRVQGTVSVRPPKIGSFNFNFNSNTGGAYTITTGHDDNLDQSINDRPFGVPRNSLRGPGQYIVNLNYTTAPINVRKKKAPEVAQAPTGAAGAPAASAALSAQDQLIQSALNAGLSLASIQQLLSQPGIINAAGAQGTASPTAPPSLLHPRMTFTVNVQNLLNNTRVYGYSGVITSPLFGRPTGYQAGRSITLSLNTQF